MPPSTGYDPIGTVQQAIVSLLNTNEPTFLALGARLFRSFAVLLLAWYGIRWMLGAGDAGERVFGFAKLLLIIAFGYAMITFYESPIPGLGSSFSNLITDQTGYLASILSARSIQDAQQTLNTLWNALEQPDPWSILANLLYWTLLIVIGLAQFAVLFVVSFGLIASAICALLGPLTSNPGTLEPWNSRTLEPYSGGAHDPPRPPDYRHRNRRCARRQHSDRPVRRLRSDQLRAGARAVRVSPEPSP